MGVGVIGGQGRVCGHRGRSDRRAGEGVWT
jgi:hypothetical protein